MEKRKGSRFCQRNRANSLSLRAACLELMKFAGPNLLAEGPVWKRAGNDVGAMGLESTRTFQAHSNFIYLSYFTLTS